MTWSPAIVFDILGTKISVFGEQATFFYNMQRLPILVISILMFVGFLNIEIGCNRIINLVASATFGVYLIHDNDYVRPFLWNIVFKNSSYSDSSLLIPYSLLVIAVVFVGCTLIELVRIYILEKHYMVIVNIVSPKIDDIKEKIFKFFQGKYVL